MKTKIAGLGTVVLLVVALTGCDLFGNSRGPGFGYVDIKPPVDRAAGSVLAPSSLSVGMAQATFDDITPAHCESPDGGQTPQKAAYCEYQRLAGSIGRIDNDMTQLDQRAQGEGVPACIGNEPTQVSFAIPNMENAGGTTVPFNTFLQCREIHENSLQGVPVGNAGDQKVFLYATLFGLNATTNTFYLVEVQDMEFSRGNEEVRSLLVSIAKHQRGNDEKVEVWSFSLEKDDDNTGTPAADWEMLASRIVAIPAATSGNRLELNAIRELDGSPERLDVTVNSSGTEALRYSDGTNVIGDNPKFSFSASGDTNGNRSQIVALYRSVKEQALDSEIGLFSPANLSALAR
jgi:hypothetical protein